MGAKKLFADPVLLLCPLRSFSSVVCAMLGQHPELYGMPELNLFLDDRLEELIIRHRRRPFRAHGVLRALAHLHDGGQTEAAVERAKEWIWLHRSYSTKGVFDHLIELVHPHRVLEKSPSTSLLPGRLERLFRMYPNAAILHLTRHPRSTCRSMVRLVPRIVSTYEDGDEPADLVHGLEPEAIWLGSHRNILDFCRRLPQHQWMRIKGEELLSNPDTVLTQVCWWLGLKMDGAILHSMRYPEHSPYACLGPRNAAFGNDPGFLKNPAFRQGCPEKPGLDGELEWAPGKYFSQDTRDLAHRLGYD